MGDQLTSKEINPFKDFSIFDLSPIEARQFLDHPEILYKFLSQKFPHLQEAFKDEKDKYAFRGVRWKSGDKFLGKLSPEESLTIIMNNLKDRGSEFILPDREAGIHIQIGRGGDDYPFERPMSFALKGEEHDVITSGQLSFLTIYDILDSTNRLRIQEEAERYEGGSWKRWVPKNNLSWKNMRLNTTVFRIK